MKINIQSFAGITPRVSPELLPENGAQIAENLSIKSGKIHPEKAFTASVPTRDMVPGQINDDQYSRIYYLDASGNLMIYGKLSGGSTFESRSCSISSPGIVTLTGKSSPIIDTIKGSLNTNVIVCNYNSNDDRCTQNVAPLVYDQRTLSPVDAAWSLSENYAVRRYRYLPLECQMYYFKYVYNIFGASSKNLYESYWKINCAALPSSLSGEPVFSFPSRSSANSATASDSSTGKLYDYNNKEVGSYSAYCEKVVIDGTVQVVTTTSNPQIKYNKEELIVRAGTNGKVENGVLIYENGRLDSEDKMKKNTAAEVIDPGDLMLVIERNYTDIDRDAVYVARAVLDYGAEGNPGNASVLVERKADEKALLSVTYDTAKAASEHWTKLRIYRSATSSSGDTDYLFLKDITLSGTSPVTFEDISGDGDLGEAMPQYGAVPEGLQGMVGMTGGFMAAFKGKDVYFSEPYLPNIWPYEYNQSVPFDIVGITSRNNYLFVMTKGPLYAFTGDSPDTMAPLNMRFDAPCISRQSICFVDGNIIYASSIGLVLIPSGGGSPSVLSAGIYTLEQYKSLNFENCTGSGCYDNKYIAFFSDHSLIFDLQGDSLNHSTLTSTGGTVSNYFCTDGSWPVSAAGNAPYGETIINQNFSSSALTAKWKSKDFVFDRPVAFSTLRIRHDGGSVSYAIYANGGASAIASGSVSGNDAVRLPVMRREKKWSVEITSNVDVFSVELAESMAEM